MDVSYGCSFLYLESTSCSGKSGVQHIYCGKGYDITKECNKSCPGFTQINNLPLASTSKHFIHEVLDFFSLSIPSWLHMKLPKTKKPAEHKTS